LFSLIPKSSDFENGLKFQVYINRLSDFFSIDKEKIITMLPKNKKEWAYEKSAEPEWSGYEGFFKNLDEVTAILNGFGKVKKKGIN